MLHLKELYHLSAKWDILYANRPSTFRNSFIFWFLRVFFNIIILLALILLATTFSRELWLEDIKEELGAEDYELLDALMMGFRIIAIFFIIISFIIVWLSKSALRRNRYIVDAEHLLDEYKSISNRLYNENPNNYNPAH